MSDTFDDLPVVYAISASTGKLRHVDDVDNGKNCSCLCPDPRCGQRLIAKNRGKKRVHHFAHECGSCSWSVEYLISLLAVQAIESAERVTFPELWYEDAMKQRQVRHAEAQGVPIASVITENISGRQAPDVVVAWRSKSGAERLFAIVFQLVHRVTEEQVARLSESTEGVILVDLREDMRRVKREEGKHYDRIAVVTAYQDVNFIASVLADEVCHFKSWVYNSTAERLHVESVAKWEQAQAEEAKRRKEREKELRREHERHEEELRHEREKREKELCREREENKRRQEEARRRAEEERHVAQVKMKRRREETERREAERRRRKEEERRREEAMRPENDHLFLPKMALLVEQQEVPAEDEFGRRWVKCTTCGKVAPHSAFASYGGAGNINRGTCSECMRKRK